MKHRARSGLVLLAALAAALSLAGAASAKSYTLLQANVTVNVLQNGALDVDEQIEYSFDGYFSGAYREIPLTKGESISDVSVQENGTQFRPGGCTDLGCSSPAGTFGVAHLGGKDRIVWHYSAVDESRTFEIHYRLSGLAVAYSDIVDVNLDVWGSEWKTGLNQLISNLHAPGPVKRAWGSPVYVRGDVTIAGSDVKLRAINIPAHQFVALRVLIPRDAFTSTSGMQIAKGPGLDKIVKAVEADAAAAQREHQKFEDAKNHPWKWLLILLALGVIPAILILLVVYWLFGREFKTGYDREYEQEPPSDLAPALVPTLLRQGGEAGSYEFTATLFDLIRRDVYNSKPVTTEVSTFAGLHKTQLSDLELSPGKPRRDPRCRGSRTSRMSSTASSTAAPRICRSSAGRSRASALDGAEVHRVQVAHLEGGEDAEVVPRHGDRAFDDRLPRLRGGRCAAVHRRRVALAPHVRPLE